MKWSGLALATALAVVPVAGFGADGVLVVERTTTAKGTRTNQIQIEKSRMRTDVASVGEAGSVILFDGAQQVIRMLDTQKKTYREMTKADVDSMSGQLNDAMAMMREQLAKLPPAQRAQAEAMMQGRGRGMAMMGEAAKTEYKKTGSDKVGKWACEKYEGYQGPRKVVELCTVSPQALGFTAADFEVSRQLTEFFSKLAPQAGGDMLFRIGSADEHGFSGVPVRRVSFEPAPVTAEITDVSRQNFPDALFAVPADFKKIDLPTMGPDGAGRGRGRGRGRGVGERE